MNYSDQEIAEDILNSSEVGPTGWVRENCPFCFTRTGKDDRRKSFSVKEDTGYYHCFRCGTKGRIRREGEISRYVAPQVEKESSEISLPEEYCPLWQEPGLNASVLSDARRYLRGRGLGRAMWQKAQIGACYKGYFQSRIIIPIYEDNKCFGFVARDYSGQAMRKYLYPMGMNKTELMWNRKILSDITMDFALVVEGLFDALPYFERAVALLGKPTRNQVGQLKKASRPIVIALDGDAWEEGYALAQKLKLSGKRAGFVKLPPGQDPGSVERNWLLTEAAKSIGENYNG